MNAKVSKGLRKLAKNRQEYKLLKKVYKVNKFKYKGQK